MKRLGDTLAAGGRSFGTWSQINSPEMIEFQHAPVGIETTERMARAAAMGLVAAVRVARLDAIDILKALDAGISHVVVPDVNCPRDAARARDIPAIMPVLSPDPGAMQAAATGFRCDSTIRLERIGANRTERSVGYSDLRRALQPAGTHCG